MVVVCKWLVPYGYVGITIYPFIFLRSKQNKNAKVVNHERIHLRQQLELLIVVFFIWYLIDYFIKLIKYRNRKKAYRNIIFEKEAYSNERDFNYLKRRKLYSYLR